MRIEEKCSKFCWSRSVYLRFYHRNIRVCSECPTPIPKGRMKCQNCSDEEKR